MTCITLIAAPLAMATTQLARTVPCEETPMVAQNRGVKRIGLSLNWVVVTDHQGGRKLQMQWASSTDLG